MGLGFSDLGEINDGIGVYGLESERLTKGLGFRD
jgi:hypothetical protein